MISVIVLVHNKLELSLSCLSALAKAVANVEHEIICVDNASTDDVNALQDCAAAFDRFSFIRNDQNWSFSIANNRAVAGSTGQHLLFLNNDVIVAPDSIEVLHEAFLKMPRTGIAGAKLIYPTQKLQHAGIEQMLWGYASNYGVGADPNDVRFQDGCERFAVTGAMMCVPRAVFARVGGFDERYRWGYEDVDLCLKVRVAGFQIRYVPNAVGVHVESATLRGVRNSGDMSENYRTYRRTWDHELMPRERAYVANLAHSGVRSVAVLGTGQAALGVTRILRDNGIDVAVYTSSYVDAGNASFCDRAVVPLPRLSEVQFDRLMVASQYFFEFEKLVAPYDPTGAPLFPALA